MVEVVVTVVVVIIFRIVAISAVTISVPMPLLPRKDLRGPAAAVSFHRREDEVGDVDVAGRDDVALGVVDVVGGLN